MEKGILLASGLVAGDALMGIIVAGFETAGIDLGFGAKLFKGLAVSNDFSIIIFFALALWIYMFATKVDKTVF